jgi:hypothetical protein
MFGARFLAIVVAVLVGASGATVSEAQVWKPKMTPGARKAKLATPKKTRKAKPKPARKRARLDKKTPVKKKAKKRAKRKFRDDDDFTIVEEDYPDED